MLAYLGLRSDETKSFKGTNDGKVGFDTADHFSGKSIGSSSIPRVTITESFMQLIDQWQDPATLPERDGSSFEPDDWIARGFKATAKLEQ